MSTALDRSAATTRRPRRLLRYLRYKATPDFLIPRSPARVVIDGVRFDCYLERDRNYRRMYFGVYEPEIVALLRRFLRPGDTFIDVGANVGYLSAVAASAVGPHGAVHSFEPAPEYFSAAAAMARLNPEYNITVNHQALGAEQGTAAIAITNLANMGWNTLVPDFMSPDTVRETVDVPVTRLDDYLAAHAIDRVALVKIDVEGFEYPVLQGLSGYFERQAHRPPILCEVAPGAYPLLGASLAELSELIRGYGYRSAEVNNLDRPVELERLEETTNVVFLPENRQGVFGE